MQKTTPVRSCKLCVQQQRTAILWSKPSRRTKRFSTCGLSVLSLVGLLV